MTAPLAVNVDGTPAPQGSKQGFVIPSGPKAGKVVMKEMSKGVKPWRANVHAAIQAALTARADWPAAVAGKQAVYASIDFRVHRGVTVTRPLPTVTPDLDKYVRATLDAFKTSGAVADDAQIVYLSVGKRYAAAGELPGASIVISVTPPHHQASWTAP